MHCQSFQAHSYKYENSLQNKVFCYVVTVNMAYNGIFLGDWSKIKGAELWI